MRVAETELANIILANRISITFPVLKKLGSFKEALDRCFEECECLSLKKEFSLNYENLSKAVLEGVACQRKPLAFLICMDKAHLGCSLFCEYIFIIMDEISEDVFNDLCNALIQMKEELIVLKDLYYAEIAYHQCKYWTNN
jgi:hypothetical protein